MARKKTKSYPESFRREAVRLAVYDYVWGFTGDMNMKYLILVLAVTSLLGCNSSDNWVPDDGDSSIEDIELTGTWLMSNEIERYKTSTDEYLSSTYISESYLLEETDKGVKYESCRRYGGIPNYGIKTKEHFYLNPIDNGFILNGGGVLEQRSEYTNEWEPEFYYKSIQKITKITDVSVIDNGTLIVNGPISIEEYSHVCIWEVSYSVGNKRAFEIMVPFDDSYVSFRLDAYDEIVAGTYDYTTPYSDSLVRVDLSSNATAYWDIVESNTLSPSSVSLNLIEYNGTKISGTFSFTGQDEGSYSGEFEAFLHE